MKCFVLLMIIVGVLSDDSDKNNELANTVKLLREQVDAFIYNRQADYNALEESLKLAMEKNTELIVLKNEVKQLRYVCKNKILFVEFLMQPYFNVLCEVFFIYFFFFIF